ncbi:hypothetical protein NXS19_003656 [Fusarium pseudograminearum]|nr:hypothetical protein NXS19_003656 [Fusarium pseudograminearum]
MLTGHRITRPVLTIQIIELRIGRLLVAQQDTKLLGREMIQLLCWLVGTGVLRAIINWGQAGPRLKTQCQRYHGATQPDQNSSSTVLPASFYLLPHGCVYRHPSIDEARLSIRKLTSSLIGDSSPALRPKKCPDRPAPSVSKAAQAKPQPGPSPRPSPGAGRFLFQPLQVTVGVLIQVAAYTATLP